VVASPLVNIVPAVAIGAGLHTAGVYPPVGVRLSAALSLPCLGGGLVP
jgi:hypothetical protein